MATITERSARGKLVYSVRVRRKVPPLLTATFDRLTDAKTWATRQEAAVSEYRANPGRVAYLALADNVPGPLPSHLRRLTQPVLSPPNRFSTPRLSRLACI